MPLSIINNRIFYSYYVHSSCGRGTMDHKLYSGRSQTGQKLIEADFATSDEPTILAPVISGATT